jgi:hypothetical protein
MDTDDLSQVVRLLKALADESRLNILGILADEEWSVRRLAERLALTEPTVSHHLSKLQALDLVRMRAVGTTHLYQLNREALQTVSRTLLSQERLAALGAADADPAAAKVLRTFFDGERLTKIPDSPKKRLVILRWLADQFEVGVEYPEAELNARIKRHHPDTATLRREMIMHGLMQRANGVYWRTPAPDPQDA